MVKHTGACHCGRVRFEVTAPAEIEVGECNCSMCNRSRYLHLVVPKDRFALLRVNARCLDEGTVSKMTVRAFDGRDNWEASAAELDPLP